MEQNSRLSKNIFTQTVALNVQFFKKAKAFSLHKEALWIKSALSHDYAV